MQSFDHLENTIESEDTESFIKIVQNSDFFQFGKTLTLMKVLIEMYDFIED